MPEPQPFLVGRQAEVEQFAALIEERTRHWLLNIFGPGGIGKSVVCNKFSTYARESKIPFAVVDGSRPDLTPDRILYTIMEGIVESADAETASASFGDFAAQYEDYLIVQNVLQRGGGVKAMFDVVGNIKDPAGFAQIIGGLGKTVTESAERTIKNRFALERYLRGVDKALAKSLTTGLKNVTEQTRKPIALLVDTYEEMEGLDDWVNRTLAPTLPSGIKVVVFGRNSLPRVNFDWNEFGDALHAMDLPELPEGDAKAYLIHHRLRDATALDQVYHFTGGYPLLLVLVVHLASEAGGWNRIGALESDADRDHVASKLLERILREERVTEVRAFLEKGVIARWFNPEIIGVILEINVDEARAIYDKLQRHSFVERHPYGLKFHDKVRELLVERLKFSSQAEYQRLTQRLMDYYADKAGIRKQPEEKPQTATGSTYNIYIQSAKGLAIGDRAQAHLGSNAESDWQDESESTTTVGSNAVAAASNLPTKLYRELIGRERALDDALQALRDPNARWIVGIHGLGGIGKTALAREIAERALTEKLFDAVVWASAQQQEFVGEKIQEKASSALTYEAILDAIARQLGVLDLVKLQAHEKETRVRALLKTQHVLIVLDNLETAQEHQDEITRKLLVLLNPSKALVTSRHRLKGEVYPIALDGLLVEDAMALAQHEAAEKKIERALSASPNQMRAIAETTGGAPLALKLVVGQLAYLDLARVLQDLREAKAKGPDYAFYQFLFWNSWRILSQDAKTILIALSHFAANGGTFEAIRAISTVADDQFASSMNELWTTSLVQVGGTLEQTRYSLHPLTEYFVLADIVKLWK